jgi:ATP-dependent exoDNAse (exonuclease V) beta subunit
MTDTFVAIDAAIREEIRTSLDATLMVEAGAGTGKTTVLVGRIVEVLRRGRYGVDEIAVMTFTEAAAAELAARVREGLEDALHSSTDAQQTARLREALAGLHRARIETIHAFATNVLRERPVEARLDPQFEVLDPLAARLAFDRSYEAWLAGLFAQDREEITTALHRGMEIKHLRRIAELIHAHRYVLPLAPIPAVPRRAFGELVAWLDREAPQLEALTNRCNNEENRAFLNGRRILEFRGQLAASRDDAVVHERVLLFRAPFPSQNAGAASDWGDKQDTKDLKSLIGEYMELRDAAQGELRAEAIAGVIPLVAEFVKAFEQERRAAGTADFDDLLLWARDLVANDAAVRDYFHRRFPRILVDEFQDTDPIQAELVVRIAANEDAADWRTLTPKPGNLFVVGDPKQSIYRFRRADIAVYDELRRGSLADGVRHITQNFRSVASILDWANDVFDRVLVEEPGVQPANVRLAPVPLAGPKAPPGVVAVHGSGDSTLRMPEIQAEEGRLLATMIHRAVKDEHWPVRDRRSGAIRPCEYRDIAILVPSRPDIEAYTEPLEDLGVPYRMDGGTRLYGRQEVRDLVSCLHAIDDPNDRISLVAALRSSACGCSDEDLFMWTADGGRLDLRQQRDAETGAVADGLRLLGGLRRERRGLSLSELVSRVIARTRLVEVALASPRGEQGAANLVKVIDEARAFAGAGGGGLRPFIGWLNERRDGEGEEDEAGLHEETDDVVRILAIHGSKGLEFPIVALAKSNTSRRKQTDGCIVDTDAHGLDMKVEKFETPGWQDAFVREDAAEDAERRRLLYVAGTRARDHLIVPLVPAPGKRKGMLEWLEAGLPEWDEANRGAEVDGCLLYDRDLIAAIDRPELSAEHEVEPEATAAEIDGAQAARSAWSEGRAELLRVAGRELAVVTASSVELLWQRPLTIEVSEADGTVVSSGSGPPLPLGDAVHRVMEVVDLAAPGHFDAIVGAVCAESGLLDRRDEVQLLVERCLLSPAVARAVASERYWREVPFTIPWEDGLAVGRMDLLFVEDGRIVIVDYKTDAVEPDGVEAAVGTHRSQAEIYAAAAHQTTSLAVADVVFVFCRVGLDGVCRWE